MLICKHLCLIFINNYLNNTILLYMYIYLYGTEMCVFALNQYLKDYNNNTNIFVAYLDASKVFDNLNHNIYFID